MYARWVMRCTLVAILLPVVAIPTWAQDQPNVVMIWGDDIGVWNLSAYNHQRART